MNIFFSFFFSPFLLRFLPFGKYTHTHIVCTLSLYDARITNRKMGWRLGLQAVTGLVAFSFFMGLLYRPASLYHPQRRAILHLKNQRKKVIYDALQTFYIIVGI